MALWTQVTSRNTNNGDTGVHTLSTYASNPPLQTTEVKEVILATTGFTDRFRRGYYRNGKRVTVQTPQVALSAISKTNDLGGGVSPIYRWDNKYITLIQRQIKGYRHKDLHPTIVSESDFRRRCSGDCRGSNLPLYQSPMPTTQNCIVLVASLP